MVSNGTKIYANSMAEVSLRKLLGAVLGWKEGTESVCLVASTINASQSLSGLVFSPTFVVIVTAEKILIYSAL